MEYPKGDVLYAGFVEIIKDILWDDELRNIVSEIEISLGNDQCLEIVFQEDVLFIETLEKLLKKIKALNLTEIFNIAIMPTDIPTEERRLMIHIWRKEEI